MTTPKPTRSWRWRLLVFLLFIGPGLVAGGALIMVTGGDPAADPLLRIGFGVLMLLLGLQSLFRLAAFGPRTLTSNRVKESLAGCALVLLGAAQLASNRFVMLAMGVFGLLCAIAMALGRPKRLFARSSHAEVSRK